MHLLRLLRIFVPLLVVGALVAGVIIVLGARHELQQSHREVEQVWTPLRGLLDDRYGKLNAADTAVRDTPGPVHELTLQVDAAYARWRDLEQHDGNVGSEVAAANALEALGRRLVLAVRAAPRLHGSETALGAIATYAGDRLPSLTGRFQQVVRHYEDTRDQPAHRLAARILGYESIPALDTLGSAPATG
jgi:hypothetical protein